MHFFRPVRELVIGGRRGGHVVARHACEGGFVLLPGSGVGGKSKVISRQCGQLEQMLELVFGVFCDVMGPHHQDLRALGLFQGLLRYVIAIVLLFVQPALLVPVWIK